MEVTALGVPSFKSADDILKFFEKGLRQLSLSVDNSPKTKGVPCQKKVKFFGGHRSQNGALQKTVIGLLQTLWGS